MQKQKSKIDELLPLTPAMYHVLLVLCDGVFHGYGIMKEIKSKASITIPVGTLYRSITQMLASGLIQELDSISETESSDERRRYYEITALGKDVVSAQALKYQKLAALAQSKRIIPNKMGDLLVESLG